MFGLDVTYAVSAFKPAVKRPDLREVAILLSSDNSCKMRKDPAVAQKIGQLLRQKPADFDAIFKLRPQ